MIRCWWYIRDWARVNGSALCWIHSFLRQIPECHSGHLLVLIYSVPVTWNPILLSIYIKLFGEICEATDSSATNTQMTLSYITLSTFAISVSPKCLNALKETNRWIKSNWLKPTLRKTPIMITGSKKCFEEHLSPVTSPLNSSIKTRGCQNGGKNLGECWTI